MKPLSDGNGRAPPVTARTNGGSTATYYYEMVKTDLGWRVLGANAIAPVGTNT